MSARVRISAAQTGYALSIVALAAMWLAMLLWGGGPLDRAVYEALYAGNRPALATIAACSLPSASRPS